MLGIFPGAALVLLRFKRFSALLVKPLQLLLVYKLVHNRVVLWHHRTLCVVASKSHVGNGCQACCGLEGVHGRRRAVW